MTDAILTDLGGFWSWQVLLTCTPTDPRSVGGGQTVPLPLYPSTPLPLYPSTHMSGTIFFITKLLSKSSKLLLQFESSRPFLVNVYVFYCFTSKSSKQFTHQLPFLLKNTYKRWHLLLILLYIYSFLHVHAHPDRFFWSF